MLGPAFNSSSPRASFQAGRIKSACFGACTSTKEGGFFQLSFCFQVLFEYRAPGCFTWETHIRTIEYMSFLSGVFLVIGILSLSLSFYIGERH